MRKLEKQTRFLCCAYGAAILLLGAACAACAYAGWRLLGAPAAAAAAIFAAAILPLVLFLWKAELDSVRAAAAADFALLPEKASGDKKFTLVLKNASPVRIQRAHLTGFDIRNQSTPHFSRRIGCLEPGQTAEVETPLSPPAGDVRDAEYAVAILTEGRYSVLLRCRCTLCKGVLHEYAPAPGSVELNRYLFKTRRFFRSKNRLRP